MYFCHIIWHVDNGSGSLEFKGIKSYCSSYQYYGRSFAMKDKIKALSLIHKLRASLKCLVIYKIITSVHQLEKI